MHSTAAIMWLCWRSSSTPEGDDVLGMDEKKSLLNVRWVGKCRVGLLSSMPGPAPDQTWTQPDLDLSSDLDYHSIGLKLASCMLTCM